MLSQPVSSLSYQARREVIERVAPCYRESSSFQKGCLLDTVIAITGYARTYAIGLLHQPSKGTATIVRPRSPRYGSEVQQALVFAWKVSNQICTKRLIPFLPTLVEALERHGHLHLSEENRSKLLSMSAATADRILQAHRNETPQGLSTTKAGSLLKQHIPLRTFHQWDDAQPGFVEADLVAHCAGQSEGGYLYTLTLTDIATGWTECLPLLYRSSDMVEAALKQARQLFPFPILGIDTDNGGEFINEDLVAYCQREQITFTRGRPKLKNDQCFVEQKNSAIVRQFVGYERLGGQQAYRQLRELYRAVRLYVNCFQPSMKLVSNASHEQGGRRVYDPAKTPLQRLLLSGVLPAHRQQELREVVEMLDPVALFAQVKQLQKALMRFVGGALVFPQDAAQVNTLLRFSAALCQASALAPPISELATSAPESVSLRHERPSSNDALNWPRTIRDPFVGEWDLILSWLIAQPERSSGDIFQELQRRSPGRYRSSHLTMLQRGVRKIQAYLQATMEEAWPQEVIQGSTPPFIGPHAESPEEKVSCPLVPAITVSDERSEQVNEEKVPGLRAPAITVFDGQSEQVNDEGHEHGHDLQVQRLTMTIEGAIQAYFEHQKQAGRRCKTLEWHQMALTVFEQYLRSERHLVYISQITGKEIGAWMECLQTLPTSTGTPRKASTMGTYARSVQAFCHWAVEQGYLVRTPVAKGTIARGSRQIIHLIEPDEFERLLQACGTAREHDAGGDWTRARNRAILWILRETGIRLSELRALRLWDVDREQRRLRVRGGDKERWMTLSPQGWHHLHAYLEQSRSKEGGLARGDAQEAYLFLSEWYRPLTSNAITLLFGRIKKLARMSEKRVSPSALRDTFAVRYLQAGGEPETLRELLGLKDMAAVKRYQRLINQLSENTKQKGLVTCAEDDL